jgi:hypothetical protein
VETAGVGTAPIWRYEAHLAQTASSANALARSRGSGRLGRVVRCGSDRHVLLAQHPADRLDTPATSSVGAVFVLVDERHQRCCGRSSSAPKKAAAARLSHEPCGCLTGGWCRRYRKSWPGWLSGQPVNLHQVVGGADQLPFAVGCGEPAPCEGAELPVVFDLREHGLDARGPLVVGPAASWGV